MNSKKVRRKKKKKKKREVCKNRNRRDRDESKVKQWPHEDVSCSPFRIISLLPIAAAR